jgi:hypothetical protein
MRSRLIASVAAAVLALGGAACDVNAGVPADDDGTQETPTDDEMTEEPTDEATEDEDGDGGNSGPG